MDSKMPPLPSMPPPVPEQSGADESPAEEVKPVVKKKGIEVVALAKGFFANHRKVEGDKFVIPSMKQLGSWMRCVDPQLQREHEKNLKERQAKVNNKADD